ncbi:MAG: type II toxin-antitoxin system HicA family toxin [Planctomycetaceae bacterium]|nr:type II toxin-antitoxin system HicA family toxin [Planctomycetaceae bacterium]MBV8310122.1 type II toxin-antitoxin system HicA family toxin [Planctomycetaceae bacterium]
MPKLPGVNHLDAVRALQKAGFRVLRQGKHIIITDGTRKVVIPRNNPVNAITMAGIILDAGLTTPGRLSSALAPPKSLARAVGGCHAHAQSEHGEPLRHPYAGYPRPA